MSVRVTGLPLRVALGIMPCVIRIRAIAIIDGAAITAAPAARRILTLARDLFMGGLRLGLLGLIRPSRWAHVLSENLLAGDAGVVAGGVVHVVHNHAYSLP